MALKEVEISALQKELSNATTEHRSEDMVIILKKLKAGVRPTEEIIRSTKIGQTVGKLRQHNDKAIAELAKELVKTWKAAVDSARKEKKDTPSTTTTTSAPTANGSANGSANGPTPAAAPAAKALPTPLRVDFDILGDKTRNACLKLIHNTLSKGSTENPLVIFAAAKSIESAAFLQIGRGAINGDYRNKMRSLSLNLKANDQLRKDLIDLVVSGEQVVKMSPEELASEERKAEREALETQNLKNARGAEPQQAETDAFECGRCKQRKTKYYQQQVCGIWRLCLSCDVY
ncbi:transcription elongation factor TFIIS [Tilletia horrida]|uniref:Transcription elongation factor TFIIS n=1 Tax=Tilletia horrida TaxID=155126 RepID=A0AAN6JNY6_9BASI|nr:transcription elongation factor TFIIS [Tilletia horrida]KAK0561492.1 transcription elongation factor TFIIS [Tilletia horrida]